MSEQERSQRESSVFRGLLVVAGLWLVVWGLVQGVNARTPVGLVVTWGALVAGVVLIWATGRGRS